MIRTTMEHKKRGNPGVMAKNIPGKPSSQKVISATVSKPRCGSDNFVYKSGDCKGFNGSPKHMQEEMKGKMA